jgi:hypothetical protein
MRHKVGIWRSLRTEVYRRTSVRYQILLCVFGFTISQLLRPSYVRWFLNDELQRTWKEVTVKYEGESVNRSQMDIKRKTCDIETWEKLFLYISFINIDTIVPSLYQCVETRSIEVFWLLSQAIPHLRFIIWDFRMCLNFSTQLWTALRQTLATVNRKHFFMNILCIESPCSQKKNAQQNALFGNTFLKQARHFDY